MSRSCTTWAAGLLLACAGLGCQSSGGGGDKPAPPTPVRCEPAARQEIHDAVQLRGTVSAPPNEDAVLSSAVPGRITKVAVTEGDVVAAGDLVAAVDDPTLASDRAVSAAAVASAGAALANAQKDVERQRKLFDQGIAARRAVDDAESRLASARSDLDSARAKRMLAGRQLARAEVRSPLAGTVVKVMRRPGELVDGTSATPIAEVADTSVLELSCDVPSRDLVRIAEGDAATVRLDALPDQAIDGVVARLSPTVDPTTSLGRVRIRLSPPDGLAGRLHLGMGGQATLEAGKRKALVVPPGALRRSQDGDDEVVVCAKGKGGTVASVHPVKLGARSDAWVEITDGLSEGDRVVVDRALGLEDGVPLAPRGGDGEPGK